MKEEVKLIPAEDVTKTCFRCLYGSDEIYAGWCTKHGFTISEDNFYECRCCNWEEGEDNW